MAQNMNVTVGENPSLDLIHQVDKYIRNNDIDNNPFDITSIDSK
jgi:hypothetical protein